MSVMSAAVLRLCTLMCSTCSQQDVVLGQLGIESPRSTRRSPVIAPLNQDLAYARSPLQDSRLFGPSPWKILALIV